MKRWLYKLLFPNHKHDWNGIKSWEWINNEDRIRTVRMVCRKCGEVDYKDFNVAR